MKNLNQNQNSVLHNSRSFSTATIDTLQIIRDMPISQLQKDLIVGTILGDGGLQRAQNWATLSLGQGTPNKEYLYYLFEHVKEFASLDAPVEYQYYDERFKKVYFNTQFKIRGEFLVPFADLFLDHTIKTGKAVKIVPSCIEELLTPGALGF